VVVEVLWKMGEGEVVGEEIGYCKGLGPDDNGFQLPVMMG
jgi:hypothetical protein